MMNKLVGKEFSFYGVCNNEFKLGRTVYEALEDEDDGYRSCLKDVHEVSGSKGIFFKRPLARVRVEETDTRTSDYGQSFDGWRLVDVEDGHVWLVVGTDNFDDYYPCFTFDYHPKVTQVVKG